MNFPSIRTKWTSQATPVSLVMTMVVSVAVGVGTLACGRKQEEPGTTSTAEQGAQMGQVGAAATGAERDALVNRAETDLQATQNEIDHARAQAEGMSGEARDELNAALEQVEQQRQRVESQLSELPQEGGESWDSAKDQLNESLDDLTEARRQVARYVATGEPQTTS